MRGSAATTNPRFLAHPQPVLRGAAQVILLVAVLALASQARGSSAGDLLKVGRIEEILARPVLMVCFTHDRLASLTDVMVTNFEIFDGDGTRVGKDLLSYGRCDLYDVPEGRYTIRFRAALNQSSAPLDVVELRGRPGVVNLALVSVRLKAGPGLLDGPTPALPAVATGDSAGERARQLLRDFKGPGPGVRIVELLGYAGGSASAPGAPVSAAGCTNDMQCKGARVCRAGSCADP